MSLSSGGGGWAQLSAGIMNVSSASHTRPFRPCFPPLAQAISDFCHSILGRGSKVIVVVEDRGRWLRKHWPLTLTGAGIKCSRSDSTLVYSTTPQRVYMCRSGIGVVSFAELVVDHRWRCRGVEVESFVQFVGVEGIDSLTD